MVGFPKIAADLDPPMFIVTVSAGEERSGCLVGFATQCSIHPPRFVVCLSDKNHTTRVAARAEALAVHVPGADQHALAELFGSETDDSVDKFSRCRWHPGPERLPILDDCSRWFAGWILDRMPLGDHVGFLLEVFAVHHAGDGPVLSFQQARRIEPGHEA